MRIERRSSVGRVSIGHAFELYIDGCLDLKYDNRAELDCMIGLW